MPILFIDPLDLWLMILGSTLLLTSYWAYINFIASREGNELKLINRTLGYYYIAVGIYALASGLWASAVWPLPGSYNIVLIDPWPIFGVALLIVGLANIFGFSLVGLTYGIAALSIPVIVYGSAIWVNGLTRQPALSGLLYILIGLSGLLSPLVAYYSRRIRAVAAVVVVLLIAAGFIALWIGVLAAFDHIERWSRWTPWYGSIVIKE